MKTVTSAPQIGASRLTTMVFTLIAGAVFYFFYLTVPMAYSYFEMHNQMVAIIPRAESLPDKVIRKRLLAFVKELDIPAESDQLIIERKDRKLRVKLSYTEFIYIPWIDRDIDLYEIPLEIEAEGPY